MYKRTYRIPFRPEYLLIEGPKQDNDGLWSHINLVSAAAPTGRNVSAFKFHLSPEAVALIQEQDPSVSSYGGYSDITIHFSAEECDFAWIEASRWSLTDSEVRETITETNG